jgi:hypothetical protein
MNASSIIKDMLKLFPIKPGDHLFLDSNKIIGNGMVKVKSVRFNPSPNYPGDILVIFDQAPNFEFSLNFFIEKDSCMAGSNLNRHFKLSDVILDLDRQATLAKIYKRDKNIKGQDTFQVAKINDQFDYNRKNNMLKYKISKNNYLFVNS